MLAAQRARSFGIGLLSGGYGLEEPERAGAYRVFADPADLRRNVDEVDGGGSARPVTRTAGANGRDPRHDRSWRGPLSAGGTNTGRFGATRVRGRVSSLVEFSANTSCGHVVLAERSCSGFSPESRLRPATPQPTHRSRTTDESPLGGVPPSGEVVVSLARPVDLGRICNVRRHAQEATLAASSNVGTRRPARRAGTRSGAADGHGEPRRQPARHAPGHRGQLQRGAIAEHVVGGE